MSKNVSYEAQMSSKKLGEFVIEAENDQEVVHVARGEHITEENHQAVVAFLRQQERGSGGVLKHDDSIGFLKWWFQ